MASLLAALLRRAELRLYGSWPFALPSIYFAAVLLTVLTVGAITLFFADIPDGAQTALNRRLLVGAIWFAPAMLTAFVSPLATIVAGMCIAVAGARCFRDFYVPRRNAELRAAWVASVCFHAGTAAGLLADYSFASILFALGFLGIAWVRGMRRFHRSAVPLKAHRCRVPPCMLHRRCC